MAQLGQAFDPNTVEPSQFDDMPIGEHIMQIVESSVEATKNGNGKLLKLTWQVADSEPLAGRKMWQNINFEHTSAQAQTIGQQQLKSICDAIGFTDHVEDSEVLHYQPCRVRVAMGKANNGYPARPEIKGVKPVQAQPPASKAAPQLDASTGRQTNNGGSAATTAKPAQTAAKPAVAGPSGGRPWGNRPAA